MPFEIQAPDDLGTMLARMPRSAPTESPAQFAEAMTRMRTAQQQAQLFPLQKQEAELALKTAQYNEQERQLGLKERPMIQNAWQDAYAAAKPDETPDQIYMNRVRPTLFKLGARPETISKSDTVQATFGKDFAEIAKNHAQATKDIADAAKTNQDVSDKARERIGDVAVHLRDDAKYDPGAFESAMSALKAEYARAGMTKIVDFLNERSDRAAASPEALKSEVDQNMITQGAEQRAAARAREKAQAAHEAAQTEETKAKTPGLKAESDIKVQELERFKQMTPADWQNRIDNLFGPLKDDPQYSRLYNATRNEVMFQVTKRVANWKGADDAIKAAAQDLNKVETAVATAKATVPYKIEVVREGAEARAGAGAPGVPTVPTTGAAAQVHGEDFLKTLPPAFAARVRNVYAGGETAPTGRSAMTGPGLQLMNAVYQAYPDYSALTAQNRRETLKQFTDTHPGSAGGQLLALNTVIHHADLYLEVANALKNGTWRPGNALYNQVASAFGSAPPTEANLVARFLAGETAKVATGGVPGEGEINGILKNLGDNASPDQMQAAGQRLLQVAAGRMMPLKERRDNANLQNFVPILGPDAKSILQRRGFDPETMQPISGGGRGQTGGYVRTYKNAAGHVIGTNDGKTWYDVQTGKQVQ